jgi:hypothetical protein
LYTPYFHGRPSALDVEPAVARKAVGELLADLATYCADRGLSFDGLTRQAQAKRVEHVMEPISEEMEAFFRAELINAKANDLPVPTLVSAMDSLRQAPSDVIAAWAGLSDSPSGAHVSELLIAEMGRLLNTEGEDLLIEELLPPLRRGRGL